MFIANTPEGIKIYANRANDSINWGDACPGCQVVKLAPADFQAAYDWVNAGHYTGAVAPAPIPDAEGHAPDAEGWAPTFDEGTPAHWALLGNTVALDPGGAVHLVGPDGQTTQTLIGEVIQAAA